MADLSTAINQVLKGLGKGWCGTIEVKIQDGRPVRIFKHENIDLDKLHQQLQNK